MPVTWQLNYRNVVWALVAVAGVLQFLYFFTHCVSQYPEVYNWETCFISDLGRSRTELGLDNAYVSCVFRTSTLALGISLLPFLLVMPQSLAVGRPMFQVLSVLIVIGIIGIGQTPYDLYFELHQVALGFWVIPMGIMAVCLPMVLALEGAASKWLWAVSATVAVAILLYAGAGYRVAFVIMQKFVVVTSVAWLVAVALTIIVTEKRVPSSQQQLLARQAKWYADNVKRVRR